MKDFGYVKNQETLQVAKKSFLFGATLLSIALFALITVCAYDYIYKAQNNEIEIVKAEAPVIKVFNNAPAVKTSGDFRIYDDILEKRKETFKQIIVPPPPIPVAPMVSTPIKARGEPDKTQKPAPDDRIIVYNQDQNQNTQIKDLFQTNSTAETKPAVARKIHEVRVQILALNSRAGIDQFWKDISKSHPDLFTNLKPKIEEIKMGNRGTFYRLQIGNFFDQIDAEKFCKNYLARTGKNSADCMVVE